MNIPILICATVLAILPCNFAVAQRDLAVNETENIANHSGLDNAELNRKVEALLQQMSTEEKVGQLNLEPDSIIAGTEIGPSQTGRRIARGEVGAIIGATSPTEVDAYQKIAVEETRMHIPLLFGFDVIHGYHTIFPVPIALASSFDPELVRQVSRRSAEEVRLEGVNWVYSPMVDIVRDPRWGRVVESAGEDAFLGSTMAKAYVQGYQQDNLHNPLSVASCVKHFAAYGAPIAGRDYNAVDMSELTLRQDYLPPYKAAVDAGAACVMSAFNSLNGVPETANPFTLTQILRREWGFGGFVVSDANAVRELLNHGIVLNEAIAAKKALFAGVDMDMGSELFSTQIQGLVESGQIPIATLDEAVRRILRVKFALGLFDHPYVTKLPRDVSFSSLDRKLARIAAEESIVLLKNDTVGSNKLLPIASNVKTIALIGPLSDAKRDMLGSWDGKGSASDVVSLKQALEMRLAARGQTLLYTKGVEIDTQSNNGIKQAEELARKADLVILALGERAGATGEASSRSRLDLPGMQEQLLEAIAATGKSIVLVLFNGRPLAVHWAAEHVHAIVEAWYPGIEAGDAVTHVLFGDVNPSGKLPMTFPRSVGQMPIYYNSPPTGRPADNVDLSHPPTNSTERFVSRYTDEENKPLFPFGWGLSYTSFSYSALNVKNSCSVSQATHCSVEIRAHVKNTGTMTGTDVAQVYIQIEGASLERPLRELRGFRRISLSPGKEETIEFDLGFNDLSFYDSKLQRVLEPATYTVWVGNNSMASQKAKFKVSSLGDSHISGTGKR